MQQNPSTCDQCWRTAAEHELRTPLTVIQAVSEIFRDHEELPEDEKQYFVEALLQESARLRHSIEGMLDAMCDRLARNEKECVPEGARCEDLPCR